MTTRLSAVGAAVLALAVLVWAPPSARADDNPLIAQGSQQYEALEYEQALQTLSAALVRPGNTPVERETIFRLLGLTYLSIGKQDEAEGAFLNLLALEPDFHLGSDVSPRFRQFFDQVRQRWEAQGRPGLPPPAPVTIEHRSPAQAVRGHGVTLRASVDDPGHRVAHLVLAYRQGSRSVFRRIDTHAEAGQRAATIPGTDVRPPLVEYYFEALDNTGLPIASRGDVAAPLRIAVPAPSSDSIFAKWWFWTGLAVLVAGGVTATYFLTRNNDGGQQPGTFVIHVM